MEPFIRVTGLVAPLDRPNVDTDQIIPKEFLTGIGRTGFGRYLLYHWRFRQDGSPDPEFVLNQPRFKGASILLGGKNFGSGSSREHAVWALQDYGFRVVIAPTFADIFFNNCFKNGLLPVNLPDTMLSELTSRAMSGLGYRLTVDLEQGTVSDDQGFHEHFTLDPFRRHCLLNGLDDIALTLLHADKIAAFELQRERA